MWLWWILGATAAPFTAPDAVAVGDCEAVETLLADDASDGARLALGWCRVRTGQEAAAVEILEPLVGEGVFAEYAGLVRASALVTSDPTASLASLEGLTLPGRAGLDVRLLRGRALVAAGRSLDAREDLRELLATDVGVEARYWLAVGGDDRGDTVAAVATYAKVWTDSTHGPWADLSAARLDALGAPVPDYGTAEGRGLVKARAASLTADNQHDAARVLVESLHEAAPASTETGVELARARFLARDYPAATESYGAVLGAPAQASGTPRDLFDYALATSRTGDYATAAVIYARLVTLHPRSDKADFASFKLGYLHYDRGECPEAQAAFDTHVEARPDSPRLDEALWFHARCSWRLGEIDRAGGTLAALIERRPDSSLVPGARYWRARALGVRGDAEAEAQALSEVIRRHPVSGYAWFAAHRTGKVFPFRTPAQIDWPHAIAPRNEIVRSEALLAAGFQTWALDELRAIEPHLRDREATLAAAHAFIAAGDYKRGRALASRYCEPVWRGDDPVAQQACTPMPEASIVAAVASQYGLDPLLPFGIMTAESALDPSVTSIAGARGLMQIMPAEAPRIHQALYGAQPYDPDALYLGAYNASVGTAELGMRLGTLGDTLDGTSLPAVIASYNGGEAAVLRWLEAWEEPPPFDEFAEDIGYTETRRYVKRVLGYVMAYRWVYGDPPQQP